MGVAVLCGAITQRLTGLGFALVSIPFLVLAIGPQDGVLLANMLSLIVSCSVALLTWREIDLRRTFPLVAGAVIGLPLGVLVSSAAEPAHLMIGVSFAAICSLALTQRKSPSPRRSRSPDSAFARLTWKLLPGVISGFMNSTAGLGGPAMVVHARAVGWLHRSFVASMQFYFIIINVVSVTLKGGPIVSPGMLGVALSCLGMGVLVGHFIRNFVPVGVFALATVAIAMIGSGVVGIRGLLEVV